MKLSEIKVGVEYAIKTYGDYRVKGVFDDLTRYGRSYTDGPVRESKDGRLLKVRLNGTYQGHRYVSFSGVVSTWAEYEELVARRNAERDRRREKRDCNHTEAEKVMTYLTDMLGTLGVNAEGRLSDCTFDRTRFKILIEIRPEEVERLLPRCGG